MNKRQTELWDLCGENMSITQRNVWWSLVESLLVDFIQMTFDEVKKVPEDHLPIYLMYAKASGKGPSVYTDQAAFKYLHIYEPALEALKKARPPKVSRF